ncbi:MAG: LacI family DNA-binding transcriptional regulator [Sedimentisphaerales bacterium]|nr:LacI family DNA-binding transcriptional regulator [Sedimentisphaerales bacterium]
MTISEVANRAKVSVSTVYRVLNNDMRISANTSQAVKKAMAEVGFSTRLGRVRKTATQTKKQKGTHVNCVAMVDFGYNAAASYSLYRIQNGVSKALVEHGLSLIVEHVANPDVVPTCLSNGRVLGVLLRDSEPSPKVWRHLANYPYVWLTSHRTGKNNFVVGGHEAVGELAARYLIDRGHHILAVIDPWVTHPASKIRLERFQFTAYQAGVSTDVIVPGPGDPQIMTASDLADLQKVEQCLEPLLDRLLALSPRATGLFMTNDIFTAIIYRIMTKRGLKPGQEASIISSNNDLAVLAGLYPRPASIDLGEEAMGQRATEQLLLLANAPEPSRGVRMIIEPVVVEGD